MLPMTEVWRWLSNNVVISVFILNFFRAQKLALVLAGLFNWLKSWLLLVLTCSSNKLQTVQRVPWRNEQIFQQHSNMYCLFTNFYWSVVENTTWGSQRALIAFFILLECVDKRLQQTPTNVGSPISFCLKRRRTNKIAQQRTFLEIKKKFTK